MHRPTILVPAPVQGPAVPSALERQQQLDNAYIGAVLARDAELADSLIERGANEKTLSAWAGAVVATQLRNGMRPPIHGPMPTPNNPPR